MPEWKQAIEDWEGEYEARAERMLDLYCKTLDGLGYEPVAYPDPDAHLGAGIASGGKYAALNHAYWMCGEARRFWRERRRAKAYRWIGMIQGLLWMGGVFSIAQLKTHNELPEEYWRSRPPDSPA